MAAGAAAALSNVAIRARIRVGQPGSCQGCQLLRDAMTSLEKSEIWN